ncbi:MAG: trypsin-like peptidase domain-containing protein [Planctomycetaceae bacterium]|nr:trypsin-like peptidase domain-containing protein [Planctomycetaceae bacterium]
MAWSLLTGLLIGTHAATVVGDGLPLETLRHCKSATAMVDVGLGTGSAFCVRADGLFLTNYHVVAAADAAEFIRLIVHAGEPDQQSLKVRVISVDEINDLALMQTLEPLQHDVIPLGDVEDLHETQSVTVLGYPFGRLLSLEQGEAPSVSVTVSQISSLRKQAGVLRSVQLNGAINPGNSGGPIVDAQGRCVAVVVAGIPGSGISLATPISSVRAFLDRPGVVIDHPVCQYDQRDRPLEFRIDIIPFHADNTPDAVELEFVHPGKPFRKVQAQRQDSQFVARIAPEESRSEERLYLAAQWAERSEYARIQPGSFRMGRLELNWLDVRFLEQHQNTWIATLTNGKRLAGKISGWEVLVNANQLTFDPASALRLDLFLGDPVVDAATYRVRGLRQGKPLFELQRMVHYESLPASLAVDLLPTGKNSASGDDVLIEKRRQLQLARTQLESEARAMLERKDYSPNWIPLKPTSIDIRGGGDAAVQDDQSVQISGGKPHDDVYTVTTELPEKLSSFSGATLQILSPGSRKEASGPISIRRLEVFGQAAGSQEKPLRFSRIRASAFLMPDPQNMTGVPAYNLTDDDPDSGWTIRTNIPRALVVEFDKDSLQELGEVRQLKWVITQQQDLAIARFRLCVTKAQTPLLPDFMPQPWLNYIRDCREGKHLPYDEFLLELMAGGANPLLEMVQEVRRLGEIPVSGGGELRQTLARIPDEFAPALDEFVIEGNIPGASRMLIYPDHLRWIYEEGPVPGNLDDRGRFVLVNGQRWDLGTNFQRSGYSEAFQLQLGPATWRIAELMVDGGPKPVENVPLRYEEQSDRIVSARFYNDNRPHRPFRIRLVKEKIGPDDATELPPEFLPIAAILSKDLNHRAAQAAGVQIDIALRREHGYQLGPIPLGTKITLQYVKGVWRKDPLEKEVSPDDPAVLPEQRRSVCLAATSRITGITRMLELIPPDTARTPFVWTAPCDLDRVVLRMNDPDNLYYNNAGQDVTYHLQMEFPGP